MKREAAFKTEAEVVAAFCAWVERAINSNRHRETNWIIYPETAGWDLLLVERDQGIQVGIEAKLTLNNKVIAQALDRLEHHYRSGPDYRAVLVPDHSSVQGILAPICRQIGLTVLTMYNMVPFAQTPQWHVTGMTSSLPNENAWVGEMRGWFPWCPEERCPLPDYVPDVAGGCASPVALTNWKVRAIKLMVILEKRGWVTRADMRAVEISPTMWTGFNGYLDPGEQRGSYVAGRRGPAYFREQHPRNYAEIEADYASWSAEMQEKGWAL